MLLANMSDKNLLKLKNNLGNKLVEKIEKYEDCEHLKPLADALYNELKFRGLL